MRHDCVNCGGEITAEDNSEGALVTVNVDGHARAAHRTCPKHAYYVRPGLVTAGGNPACICGYVMGCGEPLEAHTEEA